MANLYRKTYTKPLPDGAEVFTRRGKRMARWTNGRPGPADLLNKDEYRRYKAIYDSCPASMSPAEKHTHAWRVALTGGRP